MEFSLLKTRDSKRTECKDYFNKQLKPTRPFPSGDHSKPERRRLTRQSQFRIRRRLTRQSQFRMSDG
ncbi:hypothetical protein YC2023_045183 [Brassica napus]